jgi:hypothetical protein
LVIGERGLAAGEVEYKYRAAKQAEAVPLVTAVAWLRQKISHSI